MAGIEPNPALVGVLVFRYEYLLIEVGEQLLRKLFDIMVGTDFAKYLQTYPNESTKLQHLMRSHIVPSSYLKDLPPMDNQPNSANFDICLLIILLKNVCGLRDAKYQVWHHPAPDDTSLEADIGRLNRCRNDLMHQTGIYISVKDLSARWDRLASILQRLNLKVKSEDLPSSIEKAEQLPFDKKLQDKWNEEMETWLWNESPIANAIDDFKDDLDDLRTSQKKIMHEVTKISDVQSQILKLNKTELKTDESDKWDRESKSKDKKGIASAGEHIVKINERADNGSKTAKTKSPWAKIVSDLTGNKSIADDLLSENVLPDKSELDLIVRRSGKQTPIANRICTAICEYLRKKHIGVLKAFAAFSDKKNSLQDTENNDKQCVIFVLLKKDDVEINCEEYRIYEIQAGKIRPDMTEINKLILEFERNHILPLEQLEKLETCVQQYSNILFKKHSNLTMVSASWCKSHGLGKLSFTPCVALYVPIKGLIPLDEDPFDSTIGDYLVDVREGVFESFSDPNDYHEHLKMGCEITGGYRSGTLGTFVTHNDDNEIFAITCAHVVLNDTELKELIEKKDIHYNIEIDHKIFHPTCEPPMSFGRLRFATYCSGQNDKSGMEIALIQMNPERIPEDGSFPDASDSLKEGFDDSYPYKFSSGICCEIGSLHLSPVVVKYGSVSKLTQGKVRVRGTAVRIGAMFDNVLDSRLELYNQIEIESLGNVHFAKKGDSGALVLARSNDGLVAVGIFEGQFNDRFIVTPMQDILDRLSTNTNGVVKLLSFDKKSTTTSNNTHAMMGIDGTEDGQAAETDLPSDRNSNIEERLLSIENQIKDKLEPLSSKMDIVLQLLLSKKE